MSRKMGNKGLTWSTGSTRKRKIKCTLEVDEGWKSLFLKVEFFPPICICITR
jgi:hypothetical protein